MPCAVYKLKIYFASFAGLCVFARTCSLKFYSLVTQRLKGPAKLAQSFWSDLKWRPRALATVNESSDHEESGPKSKAASIKLTLAAVGLDAFKIARVLHEQFLALQRTAIRQRGTLARGGRSKAPQ